MKAWKQQLARKKTVVSRMRGTHIAYVGALLALLSIGGAWSATVVRHAEPAKAQDLTLPTVAAIRTAIQDGLPLATKWDAHGTGFSPDHQVNVLIPRGEYILPGFKMPSSVNGPPNPTKDSWTINQPYFEAPMQFVAQNNLPFALILGNLADPLIWEDQWFTLPAGQNPNVENPDSTFKRELSPCGAIGPWYDLGLRTGQDRIFTELQRINPHPPANGLFFVSNNEEQRIKAKFIEQKLDGNCNRIHGDQLLDPVYAAQVVVDGWNARYGELVRGMKDALSNTNWRQNVRFLAYSGLVPDGIFLANKNSPAPTLKATSFLGEELPTVYNPSFRGDYWDDWSAKNDYTAFSEKTEGNFVHLSVNEILKVRPNMYRETSVWDGADGTIARIAKLTPPQEYSAERYQGTAQYSLWLHHPHSVREFRNYNTPLEPKWEDLYQAILNAVKNVHNNTTLRRFWQQGTLVPSNIPFAFFQYGMSPDFANVPHWFNLQANVNPPESTWVHSTVIRVWSLAYRIGSEYLLYASAPQGIERNVTITIPGHGPVTVDIERGGSFYHIQPDGSMSPVSITKASNRIIRVNPANPQNVTATAISSSEITLNWEDGSPRWTQGFRIERAPAGTNAVFTLLASVSATTLTYTDQNLQPSTKYQYRIRAENVDVFSEYVTTSATTLSSGGTSPPSTVEVCVQTLLGHRTRHSRDQSISGTVRVVEKVPATTAINTTVQSDAAGKFHITNSTLVSAVKNDSTTLYDIFVKPEGHLEVKVTDAKGLRGICPQTPVPGVGDWDGDASVELGEVIQTVQNFIGVTNALIERVFLARAALSDIIDVIRTFLTQPGGSPPPPPPPPPPPSSSTKVPLMDMSAGATYLGFAGGLYPGGNALPTAHAAEGARRASAMQPRDVNGNPSPSGKIVLLSIGMSNTTGEFCTRPDGNICDPESFKAKAEADARVNHTTLAIVNGAKGGQTATTWDSPLDSNYDRIRDSELATLGLTEKQVQVAWVKVANALPGVSLPSSSADAYALETSLGGILRALKVRYPNLQQVFITSRIYAGYATSTLNPEPYAYEYGFSVKWIVQAQIDQMTQGGTIVDTRAGDLNYAAGKAPWIAWGPYLWADGPNPRSDGLTWVLSDFAGDGTHPSSPQGEGKVADMLLKFFIADPRTPWFRASGQ